MTKKLLENEELGDEDKCIHFYGRDEATTMPKIIGKLELEMNMAFDCIVIDILYDESSNVDDTYNFEIHLVGFTGNMNQAININVTGDKNNIESGTDPAFGISIWPACNVQLDGEINISNLNVGTKLEKGLCHKMIRYTT